VRSTAAALAAGKPASGVPKLAEIVGEPAVAVLKKWLGLANAVPLMTSSTSTSWAPADDEGAVMNVRTVTAIEARPMHWLGPNRIARGKLNLLAGEPGVSKSVLTCAIAAIVSTGGEWPMDGTYCELGEALL
jgi:hypothetical protein